MASTTPTALIALLQLLGCMIEILHEEATTMKSEPPYSETTRSYSQGNQLQKALQKYEALQF